MSSPSLSENSEEAQVARSVLMIRPAAFSSNDVTRPSNPFQSGMPATASNKLAAAAVSEFDNLAAQLQANGVDVHAYAGRMTTVLPDEVFPNNWISTHADGTVVLYPLMAWNRRPERRRDILDELQLHTNGFRIERVVDLSSLEHRDHFLEGTGSLVLDRVNHIGYACLSARTHVEALHVFGNRMDYEVVAFEASDREGRVVYHTNVMMSLGARFAVICLQAVNRIEERLRIVKRIEATGREVIEIGFDQLHAFAGNLIELNTGRGSIIAMSSRAAAAMTGPQLDALRRHGPLLKVPLNVIETYGGGSIRCMVAEIFLPKKTAMVDTPAAPGRP